MADILYVYGFVLTSGPPVPDELRGIDDRPVEALEAEGVRALVSRLPAAEYHEEAIHARLAELRWAAERGLEHERVVTWFVDRGAIAPARFMTLHASEDALRGRIGDRAGRIRDVLTRFAGLREWNLKVSCEREVLARTLAVELEEIRVLDARIEAASPGRRYLLERRRAELAEAETERVAEALASGLLAEAGELARETVRLPLGRSSSAGEPLVVLNAALLVEREREADLDVRIEEGRGRLSARGFRIDFSGPWAPYRFVGEEVGA